jgi:hypothetical protein
MKKTTKISITSFIFVGIGVAAIIIARLVFAAGTASLSLTPATATFSQGDSVSVSIYEDSGSDTVNAVQANFSYPASLLSFVGTTDSPAFSVAAQSSVSGGNAQIARGATTAVSGNQLVAIVRFTATGAGQATLTFTGGSAVVRSTDNGAEALTTSGASYTINSRASLYISPATKTVTKGNDIAAAIYEDSGSATVNAVQANLSYPTSLTFVSIDAAGSAFSIAAQGTGGGGSVKIGRGTTTPVSGPQLIATVHFTAASAGAASVSFASGSAVIRSTDNGAEALTETGATYTINNPPGSGGTTSTPSKTPTSPPKTTSTTPKTTTSTTSSTPSSTEPPVTTNFDSKAPTITQIEVTNLSTKSATITWQTSEPATSEVEYGLDAKYILSDVDDKLTKTHSVALNPKNLAGHKTYHFQVKSVDGSGNLAFSKDLTFRTEPTHATSKYGNFWAAFAVIVIIASGAYVGSGYIRRMKEQALTPGPQGLSTPNSGRQNGGTIIKPEGSADKVVIPPSSVVTPDNKPTATKDSPPKSGPPAP